MRKGFSCVTQKSDDFSGKRVGIVVVVSPRGNKGGAERHYDGLKSGFEAIGCCPEFIEIVAEKHDFGTIVQNYKYARSLDVSKFDCIVSTKVPAYAVSHPRHVVHLIHTVRAFDDMFEDAFGSHLSEEHFRQRAAVHKLDFEALSAVKARFANGYETARRLYKWRGLECDVLHPPLALDNFRSGPAGDYLFLPGRLHEWKRVDLAIRAIKCSKLPLRLIIAGEGPAEAHLREIADCDPRIEFIGRVSDQQLIELYANCLGVPFVPVREDYGYITIEAFASAKPVVTCTDSGEPCYFVRPYLTGLIAHPTPESLCQALEWLWTHRDQAVQMGRQGKALVAEMSWTETAWALAEAAFQSEPHSYNRRKKVTVLDMQPIDPPVGGGRLRLMGLYHNLGLDMDCTYVGTFDWPNEPYRDHMLSENLREINVPLSREHHADAATLAQQAGGKTVIDLAFSQQAYLSPEFMATVREHTEDADVVIFSHPWVYPLVKERLRPSQILIYDSHNVEGYLRAQLLDEANPIEAQLLRQVVQDENELGSVADWILTCSHEDLIRFNRLYGFDLSKMRVVPNGVMALSNLVPTTELQQQSRSKLGLDPESFVAIFIGSPYGPNLEAAEFIEQQLAEACPEVMFVIAGGVGELIKSNRANVKVTESIDEATKILWLSAANIAVNPMLSGSGTNIKMFDFMAMGLPVVSTPTGARGIDLNRRHALLIVPPQPNEFSKAIRKLMDSTARLAMGKESRALVEAGYAWEQISPQLGQLLMTRSTIGGQKRPLFSVVIPTYERHDCLATLITHLQAQVERDFEVICIDQSEQSWLHANLDYGFPLIYFHGSVKGAARARNLGAQIAQGEIIAFIDDDCHPAAEWLLNARKYFAIEENVGVEGLIYCDKENDAEWRSVSNIGVEGIGFMTANLFVRSSAFQFVGGFDLQFERPHFREDTDLGWRLLDMGEIPYAPDVQVFHPAQSRAEERNSTLERARFFQNDVLLYKKHEKRYKELFFREQHYIKTAGFAQNLRAGFAAQNVDMPKWMQETIESQSGETNGG